MSTQPTEVKGLWIRKPTADSVVVFVHGILSSGDSCWRGDNSYWPDLLSREDQLSEIGIYVFSYRSDAFSAGYSLGDAVEALHNYLRLDKLLELKNIIFACHSMGGIVVRQFLVTRQMVLSKNGTRIGLFLVASPSLGSEYANLLSALAKVFGNTQAQALRFSENNTWLNDLDRNFLNLKESKSLIIRGKELVEDQFFVFPTLFKAIVPPFSGAKYFGDSLRIPYSDHWTIAKPIDREALQHRLLVEFISEFIQEKATNAVEAPQSDIAAGEQRLVVNKLVPATAAIWRVPREKKFWGCTSDHTAVGEKEIEVFLEEAKVAKESGVNPPFSVEFPWISEGTAYVNQLTQRTMSLEERKEVASARGFIAEEERHRESLMRCISFLLDPEITRFYSWGTLSCEESATVIAAIANGSYHSGKHKFDIFAFAGGPQEQVVRVSLSSDECRNLPGIGAKSEVDLFSALRLYTVDHPDLPSMPYWFLYSKALPALLARFLFLKALDPFTRKVPLFIGNWRVGLS